MPLHGRKHRDAAGAVEMGEDGDRKDSSELLVIDGNISSSFSLTKTRPEGKGDRRTHRRLDCRDTAVTGGRSCTSGADRERGAVTAATRVSG